MHPESPIISRRQCLAISGQIMLGASVVPLFWWSSHAMAAKADKQDFLYQDSPKDGKSCGSCRMFSAFANGRGTCAIVAGDVQPNGWCLAYSPRLPVG